DSCNGDINIGLPGNYKKCRCGDSGTFCRPGETCQDGNCVERGDDCENKLDCELLDYPVGTPCVNGYCVMFA
ncbi:hypothetical protein CMI43_01070, partial [Candidatus Pacearchaeota archaeon]|nr:hypothetical protein [Candidatus Pacearchaeota archaeon]